MASTEALTAPRESGSSGSLQDPLLLQLSGPAGPQDSRPFIVREARLSDIPTMAFVAGRAYFGTPLTELISPLRRQFPRDYVLSSQRRMVSRMLSARNRSFVAVAEDEPHVPVGYMQCTRLGEDEGAREVEREKRAWWRSVAEVVYGAWLKVAGWVDPDRSRSEEGVKEFLRVVEEENGIHWEGREERKNRWHVQSVVVSEEWRGRGVGKAMMKEVIERARKQGVVVGLEASPMGEKLYRSVGFELLARFMTPLGELTGGVMMWSPK